MAERSPAASILHLAHTYYTKKEYNQASKLYMIAAEQGYETAQSNYAYILDMGLVSYDTEENLQRRALVNWMRSSSQGAVESKVKVGDYYYYGLGTPSDNQKAFSFYTFAEQDRNACCWASFCHSLNELLFILL